MADYRRARVPGGTYFFTVVTHARRHILCEAYVRLALRSAVRTVRASDPFVIDSWVLMPDHLHCIWTLPSGDSDFSKRWSMIKRLVSQRCKERLRSGGGPPSSSRRARHEETLWQRRFWEHLIRDDEDMRRHRNYIHWNPVKHSYASSPADWKFSTFHRFVRLGMYPRDWVAPSKLDLEGE